MFAGAPLPLPPDVPLSRLLALTSRADLLGAWVGACPYRGVRIYRLTHHNLGHALASQDLGFLLKRCTQVAVRQDSHVIVLPSREVVQWRTLQVATATVYLPGLERIRAVFPELRVTLGGFEVPLRTGSAEEVLVRCVSEGVRITGSRIVYCRTSHEGVLPVVPAPP
jgi:hypothetical protein